MIWKLSTAFFPSQNDFGYQYKIAAVKKKKKKIRHTELNIGEIEGAFRAADSIIIKHSL